MNRADFQKLAELRLGEAKVLLDNKRYEGAYYLIGYAVECGLKACIAKHTKEHDFPAKNSEKLYIHDLSILLKFSQFEKEHRDNSDANEDFRLTGLS